MKLVTKATLAIRGDRVLPGTVIEMTEEEFAHYDAADFERVDATPAPQEPEPEKDIKDMTVAELRAKAQALGLETAGTKADLLERISLFLEA